MIELIIGIVFIAIILVVVVTKIIKKQIGANKEIQATGLPTPPPPTKGEPD